MKQLTFLQEGSNRILSKVQKTFGSCTHMNSCQKYILYINLHILLIILSKTTTKYPRIKKIHKMIEEITRFDQKDQNSILSCYHMNCCLQKILHINLHILFINCFEDNFRNAKMM